MTEGRYLRKGSKVTIRLTPGDNAVTPGMLAYNGQEAFISRVCKKKSKGRIIDSDGLGKTKKRTQQESVVYGYELEDVVSQYGIPYTFTREMIE